MHNKLGMSKKTIDTYASDLMSDVYSAPERKTFVKKDKVPETEQEKHEGWMQNVKKEKRHMIE